MREIKARAKNAEGTWIHSKSMPDMGFYLIIFASSIILGMALASFIYFSEHPIVERDIPMEYMAR